VVVRIINKITSSVEITQ